VSSYGAYFEPDIETMPRGQLERLQEQRLLETFPWAINRSTLYRELWGAAGVDPASIRSLADFQRRAPFLSKDLLRQFTERNPDPFCGLLCVEKESLTSISSSAGTTGDPYLFAESWDQCPPMQVGMARDLWGLGLRPGDYALASGSTQRGRYESSYQLIGVIPIFVSTWIGMWNEVAETMRRYRPAFAQLGGPSLTELSHLSRRIDLRELFSCVKGVAFAGEPISARMKRRVTDEWGIHLYEFTSAGDTGLAWECSAHEGCHIWEDTAIVECLDPEGDEPVPDGEVGELVVTAIDNRLAPLVRYRTSDLVRVTRERCRCGRTHVRIFPLGRKGDETVVHGRAVMPQQVWAAIEVFDETTTGLFQIIRPQRELDALRIRVGYDTDKTRDIAELRARLGAAITRATGVAPELEMETEAQLLARGQSSKLPRVVKA
jgi:phenylacetate-CoA ligase